MDFGSLLKGLASGTMNNLADSDWADMAVAKRRPNAPPPIMLSPSQQAFGDMHSGAMSTLPSIVGENDLEASGNQPAYPLTDPDKTYAPGGSVDQRVSGLLDQPPPAQPRVTPTGNDVPQQTSQMPVATAVTPETVDAPDPHDVANQRVMTAKDQADTATIDHILAQPEKTNKWKNIGIGIATSAYNATHPNDVQRVKSWGAFKKDREIEAAQAQGAQIGAIQTGRTAEDQKQAQIDYTLGRNPTALEKIRTAAKTAAERQASIDLRAVVRSKKFDPANPAHVALATKAGLNPDDLTGWDDTKPTLKEIGGTTYKWNGDTQTFEATNLPKDEMKDVTDIDVTDENGITHTYKVPLKDKAKFAVQMAIAGRNIKSREKIAGEQIAGRKDVVNTQLSEKRSQFLQNYAHKIAQDRKTGVFKAESEMKKLSEDLQKGAIDQGTYDLMLQLLTKSQ